MQKELSASTVSPHKLQKQPQPCRGGRLFLYGDYKNKHQDQNHDDRGHIHVALTPPASRIETGRIGTSRSPETKTVCRRKERTNRLSRGGRDNSLGSAASAADFVILSYCFCSDKQFFLRSGFTTRKATTATRQSDGCHDKT